MGGAEELEHVQEKIALLRRHLDALDAGERQSNSEYASEARRLYCSVVDLLPRVGVSGTRRVALLTELATLRDRLTQHAAEI